MRIWEHDCLEFEHTEDAKMLVIFTGMFWKGATSQRVQGYDGKIERNYESGPNGRQTRATPCVEAHLPLVLQEWKNGS